MAIERMTRWRVKVNWSKNRFISMKESFGMGRNMDMGRLHFSPVKSTQVNLLMIKSTVRVH